MKLFASLKSETIGGKTFVVFNSTLTGKLYFNSMQKFESFVNNFSSGVSNA